MTTVSAWYFKAGEMKVKTIKLKVNADGLSGDHLRELIECEMLECHSFEQENGLLWTIWMNEMGSYEDIIPCFTAEKVLRKIKLLWGKEHLRGNFVVSCGKLKKDGDITKEDIPKDASLQDFINICNKAIENKYK